MKEIVIATRNRHKYDEIIAIIGHLQCKFIFAGDIPDLPEIDETGDTLYDNALIKARTTSLLLNKPCIADDTGLFVKALNDQPGIYAARYAGEGCTYEDNVRKLLLNMKGISDRTAIFRTVSVLYDPVKGLIGDSEGSVKGIITKDQYGVKGFGYDPIFIPDGFDKTYAELNDEIKNKISHRYMSFKGLIEIVGQA